MPPWYGMLLWPPHINQSTLWRCALGEITSAEKLADIAEHVHGCPMCRQTLDVIYQATKAPKFVRNGKPAAPPAAAVQFAGTASG